jgi:hypothetical protein
MLLVLLAAAACRGERRSSEIAPDPAPAPASTSAPEPAPRLSAREMKVDSEGAFETHLSWPRIDLFNHAGVEVSAILERDLRNRAQQNAERWAASAHGAGEHGSYVERCTPELVANELVAVFCRSVSNDGVVKSAFETYVWTIDDGTPVRVDIAAVVGESKLVALGDVISRQLSKQTASSKVVSGTDLVKLHALGSWKPQPTCIVFHFLPDVAAPIHDELVTSVDWKSLSAMAVNPKLVDRMQTLAAAPDTLFGYPRDAGP